MSFSLEKERNIKNKIASDKNQTKHFNLYFNQKIYGISPCCDL